MLRTQTYLYYSFFTTSAKDPYDTVTRYEYDAASRLVKQIEPVSTGKSITTSFCYDVAGNRTRYTDGRGHSTIYTYNTLGLPESVIEPATTAHPAAADRTCTVGYDAVGRAVRLSEPGAVSRQRTYDAAAAHRGDGCAWRAATARAACATPAATHQRDAPNAPHVHLTPALLSPLPSSPSPTTTTASSPSGPTSPGRPPSGT